MFSTFRTTALTTSASALLGTLCAMLPASATTFTYTQGSATDIVPSFSWTTSLSGAALDNLPPGTNITGTVSALTFAPRDLGSDDFGFLIGGPFGSPFFNATSITVEIGTNALGQITSWNIGEGIFASYPANSGEDPHDFFCNYTASTMTQASAPPADRAVRAHSVPNWRRRRSLPRCRCWQRALLALAWWCAAGEPDPGARPTYHNVC
jgi:hypothetical protein